MQGVILAAGRGTRLHPLTLRTPKALLSVGGRPIIQVVMDRLRAAGFNDIVVVVGHEGAMVEKFLRERYDGIVRICFARQQKPLGMAHALLAAAHLIREDFVLSAVDGIYPVANIRGLVDQHLREGNQATLTLMRMPREKMGETSAVELRDGRIVGVVEKPLEDQIRSDIACLSLYAFQPSFVELLPQINPSRRGEYEITDGIQLLLERGGRVGHRFVRRRDHLTHPDDLRAIDERLRKKESRRHVSGGAS